MVVGASREPTSEFAPDIYGFQTPDPCPGGAEFLIETDDYLKPFVEEFVRRLELRGWSGNVGGRLPVQRRRFEPDAMRFGAFYQTRDAEATRKACAAVASWLAHRHDELFYWAISTAPCAASELLDLVDIAQARAVDFTVFAQANDMVLRWAHLNSQHPQSAGYIEVATKPVGEWEPDLRQLVASVGHSAPVAGVLPPTRSQLSRVLMPIPPTHVMAPLPMQVMSSELAARFVDDPRWSLEQLSESTVLVTNQEYGMFDNVDLATSGFDRFDEIAMWESIASFDQGSSAPRVQPNIRRKPTEPMPIQFDN